jgi:hypothetical protein
MKLGRTFAVGLFVCLMAVTPLSSLVNPGEFEVRFRSDGTSYSWGQRSDFGFTVRLADRTGLAKGLAVAAPPLSIEDAITNYGADGRMLIVRLEGSSCDFLTHLTLDRTVNGFRIRQRTEGSSCAIGTGSSRAVAIQLWAPVDAATVQLTSDDDR